METGYYTTFMSLRANESERGNPTGLFFGVVKFGDIKSYKKCF